MQKVLRKSVTNFLMMCMVLSFITGCGVNNTPLNEEKKDMYDGPHLAAQLEYEKTKDPATGRVPRERLLTALQQTLQSREASRSGNPTPMLPLLSWTERGPNSDVVGPSNGNTRANSGVTSGRIRAIMVDSADATHKTVWAGGVDGGLWKSNDITVSPANWILVNDFLSNLAVSAICQDPTDYNIMYFCTGEAYFNADAVAGLGVFKSTDGGVTWNQLPSTTSYTRCTRILCDYQGNIYLATRGNGLLRSTKASGGASWTVITPATAPSSDICDMEISSTGGPGRLHIVTGIFSAQAYRYTDIPATVTPASGWNSPVAPFPSFNQRAEIAVSGNTLYAAPADGSYNVPTIYKSTNGGANWAATAGQPTSGWANGQGWYDLSVVINPADVNQCIVGGLDNFKTTNGGTTWTKISAWVGLTGQYVHADQHHALWWDAGTKLMFACDGGIHYSSDGGTTIRDRNIGLRLKQFYSVAIHPSTTNYFLGGTQDNGTHQLTNPGLGSSVEVTGGDGAYVAIDQDQPQYQFGAYVYSNYRRSTNGGASWTAVNFGNTGNFINQWDYDNTANKIYGCYSAGQYLRWEDPQTGSTTSIISIPSFSGSQVSAVTVSPYTANRVYFGTEGGRVVRVDAANAGVPTDVNITGVGMPGGNLSCVATGTDDQNLMVCYSNYGVNNVWVSSNGGTNWTAIDGNLPDMPVRWCMFFPGDNTKAYLATETGVWETDLINGGSTVWVSDPTFPTVRTDMIKYRPSDRTIAAGTHGRGIWTATVPNGGCTPPSITAQPANQSICETGNASFSVTATGTAPLTYQWQESTNGGASYSPLANGGVYSNVTTATMNITGATLGMNNYRYRCVVTGQCVPTATSNAAILTVGANANAGTVSGTSPLCIGATDTYTSNGTGGGGWSSSNPAVATVNVTTGLVTAVSAGTSTITYTVTGCNGMVTSSKVLTVSPNANAGTVNGTTPLCIGATSMYTNTGDPGGAWSSSNPSVATVNAASGLVTALSAGSTTITYTVSSGCNSPVFSTKLLTVNPDVNAGTVTGTSPLCIGSSTLYSSTGDPGGTWSSSNPGVATVNASTGMVTAVSAGNTTITYTVNGCGGPLSSSQSLTVDPNANAGTVSGTSPLCSIGGSATYTSDGDPGGTWSSSNPAVATVNAVSGLVTAVSPGSSTITYTVSTGCNAPVSSSKVVLVNPPVNAGTISGTTPLCIGATSMYTSNGDPGGTWNSNNPSVATVNAASGLVTAVSAGNATISYTVVGCSGSDVSTKLLTVNPNADAGTVSGTSPLCIGSTDNYTSNGDPGGTWSSSAPGVATVNSTTGQVTAVGAGTTTITYTVTGCNGPATASKVLTVSPDANAGTISGTSPLCIGATATYSSNGDPGGTWSSSTPAVATVNASTGLVTAVSPGSSTITYTVNGCNGPASATKLVTVNPNVDAGTVSGTTPLCVGATTTYTSSGDPGGTWSSSAPAIATVNASTGLVTAVGPGSANITYTVNGCNGPSSALKMLTVNPLPQGSLSANGPFVGSGTGMLTWTATAGTGPFTVVYFDGTANRTAPGVVSGVPFNVFTNPVTTTTTYTLVSVSDANCTRSSGFTVGSATITVTGSTCTGYHILGLNDVNLGENNTVNGDIGNTGSGKKVTVNRNSTVNGLIRASVITLNMPVTVTGGLFYTPAVVSLPPMLLNTAVVPAGSFTVPDNGVATINTNYTNLTIGKNAVVTINGTIYGSILVKAGAVVTFTASDINIDDLTANNGTSSPLVFTTINFANDANVRIKNVVDIGNYNRVNETSPKRVTFYMGDATATAEQFNVSGINTRVTAGVYMPVGKITISRNGPCVMTGTFISQNITSSKNVTWNCGNPVPEAEPLITDINNPGEEFNVIVFPNPSAGDFIFRVSGNNNENVTIHITDMLGKVVSNSTTVMSGTTIIKMGSGLRGGIYFATVRQGKQSKTLKIVKLD